MSKEYLEAFNRIAMNTEYDNESSYDSLHFGNDCKLVDEALERLEQIDNAEPGEALKWLEKYRLAILFNTTIVENALLKAQEQEEDIIHYKGTIANLRRDNALLKELNAKYKELEEQLNCSLEISVVAFKAISNGIYAKDSLKENKINYIPTVTLSKVGTEFYLSNHCDFCVNVRDYKTLFWLKEDKSE